MNAPLVLTYNLAGDRASQLHLICLKLRLRVRAVSEDTYAEPLAALAGFEPLKGLNTAEETFHDEMLLFVNFDGAMLNRFLAEIRATRMPGIALKAVLTPTNMHWNSIQLHSELYREHEAMRARRS